MSPVAVEPSLVPTTDRIAEERPRFRILIIGLSGMGKLSLINAIFQTSLADLQHDRAGSANIDEAIAPPHNKHLILHVSQGYYERGDKGKLERFITERSQKEPISERLHAIWLCITAPFSGGRIFETGDEMIFKLNRNKVPIIVVFTKFDLFIAGLSRRSRRKESISMEVAEKKFRDEHGVAFEKATQNISGKIPYTTVAISIPNTLQRLVEITMQSISESSSRFTRDEDLTDSTQMALAAAQRIDIPAKIAASTKAGERAIRSATGSGIGFYSFNLQKCQYAIHKDIIMVWNIRDFDEYFLSDEFYNRMTVIVGDVSPVQVQNKAVIGSPGLLRKFTSAVYKKL
ncbi:hypothetical protein F5887DRAFT_1068257 [Amanita rubescens]|nr:hypothetical protein F5887DRAFT_1068257 [Amanita rubescens]